MEAREVGNNIAYLRKHQHWTQKELAQKINVSDKAIGKWESGLGFPDICNLSTLAEAFGVSIDFLLTKEGIDELSLFEALSEYKTKQEAKEETDENKDAESYIKLLKEENTINTELYERFDVKRGLRDVTGDGVVAGLTDIATIIGKRKVSGVSVPCEGELRYRGYDINDLIKGYTKEEKQGFEETVYLLLFGKLPSRSEKERFFCEQAKIRTLPRNFVKDVIMKSPSIDMMNTIAKSLLSLASYDKNATDISVKNVLRQSLYIISVFPMLVAYAYDAYIYYEKKQSLVIHYPQKEFSTAENLLYLLRPDGKFTENEAAVLDIMLMLHAEHGGGNNSTFTTHVVTSSGTDTYSAITASLCSLKGGKHGGANLKVVHMFDDLKKNVKDLENEDELSEYIAKILNKKAFDKTGLVYGMGHAVYSLSDPRAEILKVSAEKLAREKGILDEFRVYEKVERIAKEQIRAKRKIYKGVNVNIDFYSGFVYSMLKIPEELFTPIFAVARVAGWSAHRIEELINSGKIIRPSYIGVSENKEYVEMKDRK